MLLALCKNQQCLKDRIKALALRLITVADL